MKNNTIEYFHENNIPIKWDELTVDNREKLIDDIASKKSYARVISLGRKDLLDLFTAQHIKVVKDEIFPNLKEELFKRDLYTIVDITWRVIKKAKT